MHEQSENIMPLAALRWQMHKNILRCLKVEVQHNCLLLGWYECGGLNAVLMRRQSCVEAYAEDAQAPASSFGSEKEGSLSKA